MRPAKAPRRGGGNRSPGGRSANGSGRSSFQVPSGGHPGAPRAEDVLDSLAAAAAVVSRGSTEPTGAASMDEGGGMCKCSLRGVTRSLAGHLGRLHNFSTCITYRSALCCVAAEYR